MTNESRPVLRAASERRVPVPKTTTTIVLDGKSPRWNIAKTPPANRAARFGCPSLCANHGVRKEGNH